MEIRFDEYFRIWYTSLHSWLMFGLLLCFIHGLEMCLDDSCVFTSVVGCLWCSRVGNLAGHIFGNK